MPAPTDVVLAAACRTPTGKFGGGLSSLKATQLGAIVLKESLARSGLPATAVDEVIMGHVVQAGAGQNPARQAALGAGLPDTVSAFTVNKVCGSGLKAIALAAQAVRAGDANIVLAGGMESMSNSPYLLPKGRFGYRYGNGELVDALYHDGLMDAYSETAMGETGEIVAEEFHVTREQADVFSVRSHTLAQKATESGWFKREIVPVEIGGKREMSILAQDEGIRGDSNVAVLAKLKPAFRPNGLVTAGNASPLSDGASAMVVASRKAAQEHGLDIMGTFEATTTVGVAPLRIMSAPIPGVEKLLAKTGHSVNDIDLFEHNEAFATASCAVRSSLKIPEEKFNISGGAVALGHPLGASGARVLTTLLHNLQRTGGHHGVATLCLGGGNAISALVAKE